MDTPAWRAGAGEPVSRRTDDQRMAARPAFLRWSVSPLLVLVLLLLAPRAHACAVCFGNSDSKMTQGMLAGVLVLLLIVLAVLGGFVALFIHLARKAAAVAAAEKQSLESKI